MCAPYGASGSRVQSEPARGEQSWVPSLSHVLALAFTLGVKVRKVSAHSLLVRQGFLLATSAHAKHGGVTPHVRLTWPRVIRRRGGRRLLSMRVDALLCHCRCFVCFGRCLFAAATERGQRGKSPCHAQHRTCAAQSYAAGILVLPAQRLASHHSSRKPARRRQGCRGMRTLLTLLLRPVCAFARRHTRKLPLPQAQPAPMRRA